MNLIDARKKERYSQEQVANILGVSRPTYARMEQHPEDVSIADAQKLAELFKVDVQEIFFASNCN